MNKPKFSVALIARNEALTLPRLVGSLKEFQERGGDIWVLDTGSTDNTIEVARDLGCHVEAVGDKFRIQIDEGLANKINSKFIVEGEAPVVKAGESLLILHQLETIYQHFQSAICSPPQTVMRFLLNLISIS